MGICLLTSLTFSNHELANVLLNKDVSSVKLLVLNFGVYFYECISVQLFKTNPFKAITLEWSDILVGSDKTMSPEKGWAFL